MTKKTKTSLGMYKVKKISWSFYNMYKSKLETNYYEACKETRTFGSDFWPRWMSW